MTTNIDAPIEQQVNADNIKKNRRNMTLRTSRTNESDKNRRRSTLISSKPDDTDKTRRKTTLRTSFSLVFLITGC